MTLSAFPDPARMATRIEELRNILDSRIVILGHHYQDQNIIRHTDIQGDSLELARKVPDIQAEHIIFCGVFFMAESAALLARPGQKVHLPEMTANCVMAQMAPAQILQTIMQQLSGPRKVIPLAYVNSSVAIKAIAGQYGGSVCTSANAETMLKWAMDQGDAVLFLPDKNLAWNTADTLGVPIADRHILSLQGKGERLDLSAASAASLLIWPGCCAIHARFTTKQVTQRRAEYPEIRVVVHPECSPEVVAASDFAGSTAALIKYVANVPQGGNVAVGTEINLVERLTQRYAGRFTVMPLYTSKCSHMARTQPQHLLATLEAIAAGSDGNRVIVKPSLMENAQQALERMLVVCS